jgi:hypothetical protein
MGPLHDVAKGHRHFQDAEISPAYSHELFPLISPRISAGLLR